METTWEVWDRKIFPGFYNTPLSIEYSSYEEDDEEHEFTPEEIDKYEKSCGKHCVELIKEALKPLFEKGIISKLEFSHIEHPYYYNFRNDSLIMNVDLDPDKLYHYCIHELKKDFIEGFDKYLKDNFSIYPGFIPLVEDSLEQFFNKNYPRNFDTVLEYLVLKNYPDIEEDLYFLGE